MIRKKRADADRPVPKRQKLFMPGNPLLPLVKCLLLKWAWGVLSAAAVQDIAHDARLSGLLDHELDELASIGSYGQTNKAHRDLTNRF